MAQLIGTHNGAFHCDEVLACYMLKQMKQFANYTILRSRDETELAKCDIVVDVGGIYDPATNRFDHHQRTFTDTFSEDYDVRLSSAGLVYKHYGRELITELYGLTGDDLESVYLKLYRTLIQAVDGQDNGVEPSDGESNYAVTTHLSARVGWCNTDDNVNGPEQELCFAKAMEVAGADFSSLLSRHVNFWLPDRAKCQALVENRFNIHPSGSIVHMTEFFGWKSHIHDIEEAQGADIKYVVYNSGGGDDWRIQAVNTKDSMFESKLPLPEAWRGVRDADLAAVCGIEGTRFCHASGFIGGGNSYEVVIKMAEIALQQPPPQPVRSVEVYKEDKIIIRIGAKKIVLKKEEADVLTGMSSAIGEMIETMPSSNE